MRLQTQAKTILITALCALTLAACGKEDSQYRDPATGQVNTNGGGGVVADVPLPSANNCLQPTNSWGSYNYPGMQPYYYGGAGTYNQQTGWSNPWVFQNQGFCGCPSGTMPVCLPGQGLSCMPSTYYQPYYNNGQNWVGWGWNGQTGFGFSGYYGYNNTGYGTGYGYGANVAIGAGFGFRGGAYGGNYPYGAYPGQPQYNTCYQQVGQACIVGTNSCGTYGSCQPIQGGGNVGICVR